jgi:TM2 domain-containing membrane protein YozV
VSETAAAAAPARERRVVPPLLPCVLAWLLPGLGHFYLGRRGRGGVFFAVVMACFGLGIASGGASTLIDPRQPLSYLAVFDNLATGPIELLSRRLTYGRIVYRLPGEEGDSRRAELLDRLRARVRRVTYDYGNTFLLTAGLMNILLILDAFDIATGRKD